MKKIPESSAGSAARRSASLPLVKASRRLARQLAPLQFSLPVACVYNPLVYAREAHELYLSRFGVGHKKIIFLGMNPGPWGMAQTGVPFGEIAAVRDWMHIHCHIKQPNPQHPKRPVTGFDCERSEVSGRRLWGLMARRYPTAADFFVNHLVVNYCPLTFMRDTGANITPDKLPAVELSPVLAACDAHLQAVIKATSPAMLIGVGAFAEAQCLKATADFPLIKVGRILHPSPASPAANRDWEGTVQKQLEELGVW